MPPIISIQQLNKNYGAKQVLRNINLEVHPGEVIGYIGPNGAGKSTTVKILTGLITEFEGGVYIKGRNIQEYLLETKAIIGYVPELAELYDVLTPAEFLSFLGKLHGMEDSLINERMDKLLGAFGLADNTYQRMDTFSKGMRQKVLLTAGLLHNPEIIVLDEPLSGLDANSVIIVKELIQKLAAEGKTIFYSSHMMDVVERVSSRIVLINGGQIIADGTMEQLQQEYGHQSLEKIFSQLTGGSYLGQQAGSIMEAFT